jgi:hypothetical protein
MVSEVGRAKCSPMSDVRLRRCIFVEHDRRCLTCYAELWCLRYVQACSEIHAERSDVARDLGFRCVSGICGERLTERTPQRMPS